MEERGTSATPRLGASIDRLRSRIQGAVITPADADYDGARLAWNRSVEQRPKFIVRVRSVQDVQEAIRFARAEGLPIAVQATGHGVFRSADGAVLLQMGDLNSVRIDAQNGTARIGGGAMWKDVLGPAHEAGFAALSGSAPHVGVVGYTLGGGYSLLSRKYGLAVDQVRSLQIVTADGELRTADATQNEDLFWAVRGGGGAFGVVTEIEIGLLPCPTVFGGSVLYPIEMAGEALQAYVTWSRTVPDEVTSSLSFMTFPPAPFVPEMLRGKSFVIIVACVAAPQNEAEALLQPMRELGTPVADTFGTLPYSQSGMIYQDPVDPLPAHAAGVILADLPNASIPALIEAIGPMPYSPNLKIELRHLGGAVARVPRNATPIGSRRHGRFVLYMLGVPNPHATKEAMTAQSLRIFEVMAPHILCRGPLNFLGEGNVPREYIQSLFDASILERLTEIKQRHDPDNLFAFASLGLTKE